MSWKPSDKLIQATVGLLLLTVSAFFLWRNTLRPISAGLRKEGVLSTNLKQGLNYLTGQDPEELQNKEKEKLRLEEQVLQEKLDQLRKKRESLQPVLPPKASLPAPESAPQSDTGK